MEVSPKLIANRLIARLPIKERRALLDISETVGLEFGQILCQPDTPFRHVHFPLTGFLSLVAEVLHHPPLEMGLIGNEGLLGATLVLGVSAVPLRGIVQGAGTALRIEVRQFCALLETSPALRLSLNRYLYVLMAQLSQTAVCTRFHELGPRLARWLLMSHDRAHADHFHLTHQFLADMLGVRRSGVTTAAGVMQAHGLISYTRGEIRVLDRAGLEATSCECYAEVIADYAEQMGEGPLTPQRPRRGV
ncbi:Crp/Fnr family transcriptional regulator [Nevskia ramosa]|uniref:Crp/Fnr family transcriptional regulator n=1 Tax=Nevskia ramosa TaxID=64002 RepID=UPI0003B6DDEC